MTGRCCRRARAATPSDDFEAFAATLDRFALTEDPDRSLPLGLWLAGVFDLGSVRAHCANIPCLWPFETLPTNLRIDRPHGAVDRHG